MAAGAVLGKIFQIVGGLMGTAGQYQNDMAKAQQLKWESEMSLLNAQRAMQDKKILRDTYEQERANISKQELQNRADARVGYASGNVAVDEGSALDFDIALAEQAAAERAASQDQQALENRKLNNEIQDLLYQSQMYRDAYRSQKDTSRLGAGGGILSTVGGAFSLFGGK